MNNKKIVTSGFRVMKRYKLRTFFMMLGIIIGTAALTLILTLGKGTKQQLINKVRRLFSTSNILVSAGGGQIKGSGHDTGGPTTTLTLQDLAEIKEQAPNIEDYDGYQMAMNRPVKYKQKSIDVPVLGNTPNAESIWNRGTVSGSFYTDADMKQSARVALLGNKVVEALFDGMDPVGEQIRIGNVPFRVIGVLEPMGLDPHGTDRDYEIDVPVTTLMRRVLNVDYIIGAKFQVSDESLIPGTVAEMRRILRERHHLNEDEPDDFNIFTPERVKKFLSGMTSMFSMVLPLIAGISLLAGGIVIAALMLLNVNGRTSEIGLRKALGARSKDILFQFMAETTVITVTGGLTGFLLGTAGALVLVMKMGLPAVVPWEAFLLGMVFSAMVGMLAGILPARRAAALDPVETLR
jgi:putative ABC transport system permease protein